MAGVCALVGFPMWYKITENTYVCIVGDLQLSVGIATVVVACMAAAWTKSQFMYEKRVNRIELFNTLCQIYDFDNAGDLKLSDNDIKDRLSRIAQIAAAINLDLIDESERAYFESRINSFLKKESVIAVLSSLHQNDGVGEFDALLKYVDDRPGVFDLGDGEENVISRCSGDEVQREIQRSELEKVRCVVVRVNRQYREGMTSEELYEIARGYWRVDAEKASRAKFAIVVANGIVRDVFAIKSWEGVEGNEFSKRKRFVGSLASVEERKNFLGGSVKELFRQGDQNPIRYFGVD